MIGRAKHVGTDGTTLLPATRNDSYQVISDCADRNTDQKLERISGWTEATWRPLLAWTNFFRAWVSNYTHDIMCNEMIYPLSNVNGAAVEVWDWIGNFIPNFTGLGLFIHTLMKVKPC